MTETQLLQICKHSTMCNSGKISGEETWYHYYRITSLVIPGQGISFRAPSMVSSRDFKEKKDFVKGILNQTRIPNNTMLRGEKKEDLTTKQFRSGENGSKWVLSGVRHKVVCLRTAAWLKRSGVIV